MVDVKRKKAKLGRHRLGFQIQEGKLQALAIKLLQETQTENTILRNTLRRLQEMRDVLPFIKRNLLRTLNCSRNSGASTPIAT
jgi:hypothetical protein